MSVPSVPLTPAGTLVPTSSDDSEPMRPFLIDTDTASDDAVALIMALRSPGVLVEGITVVAGNVPLEQAVRNALYTVELCGEEVPVYAGAEAPLARPLQTAEFFHGWDGLGDRGYPPPSGSAEPAHAADAIVETARARPGLTVVTLGPLTNVALALRRDPGLSDRIGRLVVMGGAACAVGNITPVAEFNLWVDPEAAREVFDAGIPTEMVGWELCRGPANLTAGEMARVKGFDTEIAHFAIDCNATAVRANRRQSGDPGLGLPDPVAMAIAIDPDLCLRLGAHHVMVETDSPLTRGMTVVDRLGVSGEPQNAGVWGDRAGLDPWVDVCWELDVDGFKENLFSILAAG